MSPGAVGTAGAARSWQRAAFPPANLPAFGWKSCSVPDASERPRCFLPAPSVPEPPATIGRVACDHRRALRGPRALLRLKILLAEAPGGRQGPALPCPSRGENPNPTWLSRGVAAPQNPANLPQHHILVLCSSRPHPQLLFLTLSHGDPQRPGYGHSTARESPAPTSHLRAPPAAFSQPCSVPTPRPCPSRLRDKQVRRWKSFFLKRLELRNTRGLR